MPPCTCVLRLAHRSAAGAARVAATAAAYESWSASTDAAMAASHTALGRELGGHAHVGAVVLDRLVHRDRSAELDPLLGVGRGHLGALEGDAHRLRGEEQAVAVDEGLATAGDDRARRAVEGDPSRAPGGVEVLGGLHRHAVAHVHDGDVVADRDQQHVGVPAAQHRAGVAGGLPVGHGHRAAEGDGAEGGAVREAGKPGCLGRVVGDRVERGAGDHRRDERSGRHRPAERLDHHDELLEPVARTAVLLREVEPQPAQVDQVVPEVGDGLGRRLEQRPGGTASVSLLQELRGGVGEGLVVFGDGDRHGRKRRPRAPHPLNGP